MWIIDTIITVLKFALWVIFHVGPFWALHIALYAWNDAYQDWYHKLLGRKAFDRSGKPHHDHHEEGGEHIEIGYDGDSAIDHSRDRVTRVDHDA